jgi:hypothetical protein
MDPPRPTRLAGESRKPIEQAADDTSPEQEQPDTGAVLCGCIARGAARSHN